MAWQNVYIPIQGIPQSTITDFSLISQNQGSVNPGNYIQFTGAAPQDCQLVTNTYVWGSNSGLAIYAAAGAGTIYYQGYKDGSYYAPLSIGAESDTTHSNRFYSYVIAINEETQKGYIGFIRTWNSGGVPSSYAWWPGTTPTQNGNSDQYTLIKNSIPVSYNWKTVPSITGKLGIFNFSQVKESHLNDGEAVTGAPESYIERLVADTNLSVLKGNIPYNTETDLIYAGQVDRLTMEVLATESGGHMIIGGTKLRFYIANQVIYQVTWSVSDLRPYWLQFLIDEDNQLGKLSHITKNTSQSPTTYNYNTDTMSNEEMELMYVWLHSHIIDEDTESTDNIGNEDEGGDGWDPWRDIDIDETGHPQTSAIETGFTTMYKVSKEQLQALSTYMWSETFVDGVKKFFNDPSEIIIAIMMMPVTGSIAGNETEIKAGRISTGVMGKKLTSQYFDVDMGEIDIKKETNTFLDYPPIASASLFLPYCGEHSLDMNDIAGKTLKLKYTFDMLSGSCIARLKVNGSTKYQYSGQCGVQIPISAADYSRVYSGILSAGATIGGLISTLASDGMSAPLLGEAGTLINNMSNMTPKVSYSSGGGGNTGYIGQQMPFLKLELANPLMANDNDDIEQETETEIEATRQYNFVGKPSYRNLVLSDCTGYTKCKDVHLKDITGATGAELDMINSLLIAGVIINPVSKRSAKPNPTPVHAGSIMFTFIKCKSEKNVIGKNWGSASGDTKTIEGRVVYDQSLQSPRIIIEGSVIGYNYCYAALFDRYYYVKDIIARTGTLEEVSLEIDVLNSFTTQILACRAIVERQEKKGNLYMTDGNMYAKANKRIITVPFMGGSINHQTNKGKQCFVTSNDSYILTVAGGD